MAPLLPKRLVLISSAITAALLALCIARLAAIAAETADLDGYSNAMNAVRKSVGVAPLKWSDEISITAARKFILLRENCTYPDLQLDGYGATLTIFTDQLAIPANVVKDLASGSRFYNHKKNLCDPKHPIECRKYIQIVQNVTKSVGCHGEPCDRDTKYVTLCLFLPKGNPGQPPY